MERIWKAVAIAMSVVAVGAVALWGPWRSDGASEGETVYRLSVPIEPLPLPDDAHGPAFALSPDASMLAYVSGEGDAGQIYVRPLDSTEAVPVAGAENASNPFFSPDGEWLGFVADGKLTKLRLSDGTRVTICDAPGTQGASWGADGTIVFGSLAGFGGGLSRVSADGDTPELLLRPVESTETYLVHPSFLPEGDAVLFTAVTANYVPVHTSVVSLRTGERSTLIEGAGNVRYLHPGYLVYAQDGGLFAVEFDAGARTVVGSPVRVVRDALGSYFHPELAHFDLSADGTLIYLAGGGIDGLEEQLVWVDRDGQVDTIPMPDRRNGVGYAGPRLSPDGTRIALWSSDPTQQGSALSGDLWLADLTRGTLSRLPSDRLEQFWAVWDPDGDHLVFTGGSGTEGKVGLFSQRADGTTPSARLTTVEGAQWQQPYSVTADGTVLLFQQSDQGANFDIWVLPLSGGGDLRPFLDSPAEEFHPAISPDGHWLAYVSTESGQEEIYLTDFPEHRSRWQLSAGGGTGPAWGPEGRELFYVQGVEGQTAVVAVSIEGRPDVRIGRPEILFRGPFDPPVRFGRMYDVSLDGERFLMIRQPERSAALERLTVVLNWASELKRLVGP
jgi:serine/threonine-protein kinase